MSRRQHTPLRALTAAEHSHLVKLSRAGSAPAALVARAKILLTVAAGHSYTSAARAAGRRSGDAVAQLVARFNQQGLAALEPGHGGGPACTYTAQERARILAEADRSPDRDQDGTATWTLSTLQRALRRAPDGLPHISRDTVRRVLRDAGRTWQKDRSWCTTGSVMRKRKTGLVRVTDPETVPKKT